MNHRRDDFDRHATSAALRQARTLRESSPPVATSDDRAIAIRFHVKRSSPLCLFRAFDQRIQIADVDQHATRRPHLAVAVLCALDRELDDRELPGVNQPLDGVDADAEILRRDVLVDEATAFNDDLFDDSAGRRRSAERSLWRIGDRRGAVFFRLHERASIPGDSITCSSASENLENLIIERSRLPIPTSHERLDVFPPQLVVRARPFEGSDRVDHFDEPDERRRCAQRRRQLTDLFAELREHGLDLLDGEARGSELRGPSPLRRCL